MPFDWARVGHEILGEFHMGIFLQAVLYPGIAFQLFRPPDPAIDYPNLITGFGVVRERLWRAFKVTIFYVIVLFALALFGANINY